MSKHRHLVGFSLLLLMLFLPNSAVAASGGSENARSPHATALDRLLELVSAFVDLGPGFDPWGNGAPSDETTNEGNIGHLWDPWGSPAPRGNGDLRSGIDPDGELVDGWDPWG